MWAPGSQWGGQWPLDPATYQNLNHEHVDWAALAQQWIRMKEVHETVVINVPANAGFGPYSQRNVPLPPQAPPAIGFFASDSSVAGGEAPMDVEKEDEIEEHAESSQGSQDSLPSNWEIHAPRPKWTPPITPSSDSFVPQAFHNVPPSGNQPQLGSLPILNSAAGRTVGSSDEDSGGTPSSFAGMPALDAAKRKQLPAWIREGLEKMEREKQKREERYQFLQNREVRKKEEVLISAVNDEKALARSRFDDDDDEDDDEEEQEEVPTRAASPPGTSLSMEDLVVVIRRLMTEILLEVTSEEIRSAANDAYTQRLRVKNRAAPQPSLDPSSKRVKPLTHQLGLDQYGSDDDDDEDAAAQEQIDSDSNSEKNSWKPEGHSNGHEAHRKVDEDSRSGNGLGKNGVDREGGLHVEQLDHLSKLENREETKVEKDTSDGGGNRNRYGGEPVGLPGCVGSADTNKPSSSVSSDKRHEKSSHPKKRSRSRSRSRERKRSRSRERSKRSNSRRRSKSRSRDRRRSRSRDRYHRRRSRRSRSPDSRRRSRSRVRSRSRSKSRGRSSRTHRSHTSRSNK